jgi:hypothetical protein
MPLALASTGIGVISNVLSRQLEIRAYKDAKRTQRIRGLGFRSQINPANLVVEYRNELVGETGLNSAGASLTIGASQPERIKFKLILTDSSTFHFSSRNTYKVRNAYFTDGRLKTSKDNIVSVINNTGEVTETYFHDGKVLSEDVTKDETDKLFKDRANGTVAEGVERFLNLTTQEIIKDGEEKSHLFLGIIWGQLFIRPDNTSRRQNVYPVYLESVDVNYTQFHSNGTPLRAELDCIFREDSTDEVSEGG